MCRPDVIECLSTEVRKAIVDDTGHKISDECRSQLQVEKLRQVEYTGIVRENRRIFYQSNFEFSVAMLVLQDSVIGRM